jgi:hypothetical protein
LITLGRAVADFRRKTGDVRLPHDAGSYVEIPMTAAGARSPPAAVTSVALHSGLRRVLDVPGLVELDIDQLVASERAGLAW